MKLYKFDYKGTIGNNIITVPTDSQFLVGIGNGDAESTTKLFDGDTELIPEEDKIDEYTCFRFETDSTPFRKPYRAEIGQQSFHDEEAFLIDAGNVPDEGEIYVALAIPKSIQLESLVSDGTTTPQTTSLTAYIVNHASDEEGYPADFEYQKSVTLTWDAEKGGFAMSEPIHCTNSGDAYTYTCVRITGIGDEYVWSEYYGALEDAWFNQGTPVDYYDTIPAPVITTLSIDLLIICQKMSVAYRDFESGGSDIEIVTTLDSTSTDTQVPSAKCVYDIVGDIETLINAI